MNKYLLGDRVEIRMESDEWKDGRITNTQNISSWGGQWLTIEYYDESGIKRNKYVSSYQYEREFRDSDLPNYNDQKKQDTLTMINDIQFQKMYQILKILDLPEDVLNELTAYSYSPLVINL